MVVTGLGALSVVPGPGPLTGAELTLLDAVKRGDDATVQTLLSDRSAVNAAEADGTTPLHWAAHAESAAMVKRLLGAGANANAANRYGITPLSLACTTGNPEVVEALLDAGADANALIPAGETILMTAARTGNPRVVQALLGRGAAVNATESWRGQTALMWAAAENNAEVVRLLIGAGADLGAHSTAGFTPLLYAARGGQIESAKVLLAAGADINQPLPNGVSPLVLSIINAKFELASVLVEQGADPNDERAGWTALHQVAWTRRPNVGHNNPEPVHTDSVDSLDLVRQLIAHGADPNRRVKKEPRTGLNSFNRIGATPFLLAAKDVDVPYLQLLLASGADPWLTNADGTTALMVAAGVGMFGPGEDAGTVEESLEAVKLLFAMGFETTAIDKKGETALHGAAFRGANDVVRFLVDNGGDLDAINDKGWSPLKVAEGIFINATLKSQPKTAVLIRRLVAERASSQ